MPGDADYRFQTRWRVEGTCGEVADIISDPLSLPRWWPAVYLDVRETRPGDARGVGRQVALHTKGWLPYTLRWQLEVVESHYPNRLVIEAHGDFEGRGVWTFVQDGRAVNVFYDWRVRTEKPLLEQCSFLFRPVFEANHRWAMAQGEESLALELRRRRAVTDDQRRAIEAPPGPVTLAGMGLVAASVVGVVLAATFGFRLIRRISRRAVSR